MKNAILIIITSGLFAYTGICGPKKLTKEQEIVAKTILGEARGEGKAGMYWVAAVIAQRTLCWKRNGKKMTATQVCLTPYQFSCWNKNDKNRPKLDALLKTHPHREYAIRLAQGLPNINRIFFKNVDHYHNYLEKPYWIKGEKPVARVGKHIFYKLRP